MSPTYSHTSLEQTGCVGSNAYSAAVVEMGLDGTVFVEAEHLSLLAILNLRPRVGLPVVNKANGLAFRILNLVSVLYVVTA